MNSIGKANKYKWIAIFFLFIIGSFGFIMLDSSRGLAISKEYSNYDYYMKEDNISINISYGYDGYGKYGRYINIHSDIYNPTMDFSGYLEVTVPKKNNNSLYQKEIKLDSNESLEVDIAVPLADDTGILQVRLINKEGKTILDESYNIKIGNYYNETYIGVLSDENTGLEYLDKPGTKVFYLDPKHMTEEYYGLDVLDVIVINQFDTSILTKGQLDAILKWVMNGGTLAIGTGEEYKTVLSGLNDFGVNINSDTIKNVTMDFGLDEEALEEYKSRIFSYIEKRKVIQNDINNRNEMLAIKGISPIIMEEMNVDFIKKEIINSLRIDKINKNLADVSIPKGEKILLNNQQVYGEKKQLGNGNILLFKYDLGLDKKQTSISLSVLYSILTNLSSTKKIQLSNEYYGYNVNYGITSSMNYADTNNIPNVWDYAIILIVYILLVGPVTYFVLKKMDKRSFTWAVVPCLAIIFTLIVYIIGGKTRINEPFVGYVELKTYQEDNTVLDEIYFAFTAPHNHEYGAEIDSKYTVKELTDGSLNYYLDNLSQKNINNTLKFTTMISYEENMTKIKIMNNPAFVPMYYQYNEWYDEKSQLEYEINYTGNKFSGTITNNFNYDIADAILVSDGFIFNLGVLESMETVNIDECEYIYLNVREELYGSKLLKEISGAPTDETYITGAARHKYNLLNYLIDKNIYSNEGSYIIGFTYGDEDKKEGLVSQLSEQMDTYGTEAIVLPVNVNYTKDELTFVPAIDKYIKGEDSVATSYYNTRYLSTDELNLTYVFPSEDDIVEFQYLSERNTPVSVDYLKNFVGEIYFKNQDTNKYDKVFTKGVNSKEVNPLKYLSDNNELEVLYKPDISLQGSQIIVPHISYLAKEKDSVRN